MNVKLETKEKFTVVIPLDPVLSANMTVDWNEKLLLFLQKGINHIILNLQYVNLIENEFCINLFLTQQNFYKDNFSFVICNINEGIKNTFKKNGMLDKLNYTPTESEAWDIVQMDEIERELLGDD